LLVSSKVRVPLLLAGVDDVPWASGRAIQISPPRTEIAMNVPMMVLFMMLDVSETENRKIP